MFEFTFVTVTNVLYTVVIIFVAVSITSIIIYHLQSSSHMLFTKINSKLIPTSDRNKQLLEDYLVSTG